MNFSLYNFVIAHITKNLCRVELSNLERLPLVWSFKHSLENSAERYCFVIMHVRKMLLSTIIHIYSVVTAIKWTNRKLRRFSWSIKKCVNKRANIADAHT